MKLAKVEHIRCDSYDGDASYLWVPDDLTEDAFEEAIDAAIINYLQNLQEYQAHDINKLGYWPPSSPDFKKYPDKTVQEVLEIFEKEKAEWNRLDEIRVRTEKTFTDVLISKIPGAQKFWDHDEILTASADWGHRHGTHINYGVTNVDYSGPSIKK